MKRALLFFSLVTFSLISFPSIAQEIEPRFHPYISVGNKILSAQDEIQSVLIQDNFKNLKRVGSLGYEVTGTPDVETRGGNFMVGFEYDILPRFRIGAGGFITTFYSRGYKGVYPDQYNGFNEKIYITTLQLSGTYSLQSFENKRKKKTEFFVGAGILGNFTSISTFMFVNDTTVHNGTGPFGSTSIYEGKTLPGIFISLKAERELFRNISGFIQISRSFSEELIIEKRIFNFKDEEYILSEKKVPLDHLIRANIGLMIHL